MCTRGCILGIEKLHSRTGEEQTSKTSKVWRLHPLISMAARVEMICAISAVSSLLTSPIRIQLKPVDVGQQLRRSSGVSRHLHLRPAPKLVLRRNVCPWQAVISENDARLKSSVPKKFVDTAVDSGRIVSGTGCVELLRSALGVYFKEVETTWVRIWRDSHPASELGRVLAKEWKIVYLLTFPDFAVGILPFYCVGANILILSGLSGGGWDHNFWTQAATTMSKEALYSFLYLHSFNFVNHYVGASSDAVDKPWRPIPAGLLDRQSCLARAFLACVFYDFVSWQFEVLPWTLLWQVYYAAELLGVSKDRNTLGLVRSVGMGIGTAAMCGAAVSVAVPMNFSLFWWVIARGVGIANNHWIQDFRDVAGDEKMGRKTFPIVLGMERARKLMAFIYLMDPVFMHFVVLRDSAYTAPQLFAELVTSCLSASVAFRVLNYKTPEDDHETYTTWMAFYWFNCSFLAIGPGLLLF